MESKETVLSGKIPCRRVWIPAFAGMTAVGFLFLLIDSCGFSVAGFPLLRE
ncbi:hypothetical protein NMA510612_1339 [Neisseria meningitidis]|uniref:Uncharacterized protein n=1 Tax=Neisseria meningitidis TaxID=487 RepID=X5ERI5_NEIME|nr:hypothetical protein NMA510612_1339 [Neisseria meningitidis]